MLPASMGQELGIFFQEIVTDCTRAGMWPFDKFLDLIGEHTVI